MKLYNTLSITAMFSTVILSSIGYPPLAVAGQGVDDLRGRWDIDVGGLGTASGRYLVFVNDLKPDPDTDGAYLAAGCMQSPASGVLAPLSLRTQQTSNGAWEVSFLSTVVPQDNPPFVIRFLGPIYTLKQGVSDDVAGGQSAKAQTEFTNDATWQGIHHDRQRKKCPAVEIPPLMMRGDVTATIIFDNDYGGATEPTNVFSSYELQTDIAAAAARVQRPDGTMVDIKPLTDFLQGTREFYAKFVWYEADPGYPVSGGVYRFILLDAFGREIAGATAEDRWTACTVPPPRNLSLSYDPQGQGLRLQWEPVTTTGSDEFGMYGIEIRNQGDILYNAAFIPQSNTPEHLIPYSFVPGAAGSPSGYDFGLNLNELPSNASYVVQVDAFATASGHVGWECHTTDFYEGVEFTKDATGVINIP